MGKKKKKRKTHKKSNAKGGVLYYVNPTPEKVRENQSVSIALGFDTYNNEERPMITLVYKTKKEAKESFAYFKKITSGKFDDVDNDLIISYVLEDDNKYALFTYPSKQREKTFDNIDGLELEPSKTFVVSFVNYYPSRFSGFGNLIDTLDVISSKTPYLLQSGYSDNGNIVLSQKRPILKYHLRIIHRSELDKNDIEFGFPWYDVTAFINK